MNLGRALAVLTGLWLAGIQMQAAPLVTGNGFGFAVVSPSSGEVRKYCAHPYSFARPDPDKPLFEGIETMNFIKSLHWSLGRHEKADAMLACIVAKSAAGHNFIAEMYVAENCPLFHGAIGDPTGAIPMAGYGAGAYIDHLLQREHLRGPSIGK